MGLNDQAKAFANKRKQNSKLFKDGVQSVRMSGKEPKAFRMLPAFHPQVADPQISWMPSVDPNGNLTDWAFMIQVVPNVGHGKFGSEGRQDILSPLTFATPNEKRYCPLTELHAAIQSDMTTWGYLLKDQGDKENRVAASFGKVSVRMLANVVELNQTTLTTKIGIFPQSAATSLIDAKNGLVLQPNGMPGVEELIKTNYLYAYANGDITDPNNGPILSCEKAEENKGDYSSYRVVIARDASNKIIRRALDTTLMAGRYRIGQPDTYLMMPTDEEIVQMLVMLLNGRSPATGFHEHALLKFAFPNFRVPDAPAAPAASPMIPSGFAPSPVPQAGSGQPVAIPGSIPSAPAIPGMPPAAGGFTFPAATVPPAPATVTAPTTPTATIPPAVAPATVTGGEMSTVTANIAKTAATIPVTPTVKTDPVVPGDPVQFDQNDFIRRMREMNSKAS